MTEEFRPYLINQQAANDAVAKIAHLPDEELYKLVLEWFQKSGYPGDELPPHVDTSREGLLDMVAGIAAIAFSEPVSE